MVAVTEKRQHSSLFVPITPHTCKVNMRVSKQINMDPVFYEYRGFDEAENGNLVSNIVPRIQNAG